MDQFDISIIIPIYNCEQYIEKCVESIENQDYQNKERIEVILVDDGSVDNSLEVCKRLKEEIKSLKIEIITGKNGGVSSARNKGIKAAKGKYIMFIDSDDYISKPTIKNLIQFFDDHYNEIDLATYPMYKFDVKTKQKEILYRYKECFKETKVYDLEKEYYAIQPTMNIIVKNLYKDNKLFDEKIFFHEDTFYITQIVMEKRKIGFVAEAKYIYRVYGNSTTDIKENPLYCFDQYMTVFETLFNKYEDKDGKVPRYVQRIALNVIRFRVRKDKIFPYYLEGEEWDKAYKRIVDLLKRIDNKTIMQYTEMDRYHKLYLLKLKQEKIKVVRSYDGKYTINDKEDNILAVEDNIEIAIRRFKLRNGKIQVLGILKSILFSMKEPQLIIKYKTKKSESIISKEIKVRPSNASYYKTSIKVADFYEFYYEIDMDEVKEFEFILQIDGKLIDYELKFSKNTPFNEKINNYKIYKDEYRVQYLKEKFYISKPKKETIKKDIYKSKHRYAIINKKINFYKIIARIYRKGNKKIWIYIDRKGVFDNGYSQFKHDIHINDNIQKYYIIDDIQNNKDKFTKKELKNVVEFGSFKHKVLYLNSDKILTSFSSLSDYCPLIKNYKYYKDDLHYELIYLQHGILHAKLLKMYSKAFTQIDKFVVSSKFEEESLINEYGYSEEDLIKTGMPRLDDNKLDENNEQNKIIYAPSWRKYLIGETFNRSRQLFKDKFTNSGYYKEIVNFLQDEKLLEILKKNNIIIDFKLHPIFEDYKDCFDCIINDNVTVSIGNTDLSKYKAFITDFSSFQFDYVNLQRPIIYFMPDMNEFKAGLHSYRELSLDYKDAFGNLCLTGEELSKEIIKLINNNYKVEEPYKTRMKNFFFKVDNRKDKLYEILKGE